MTTLTTLGVVSSIVHLKLKNHIDEGIMVMVKSGLNTYRSCFLASLKLHRGRDDPRGRE